MTYSETYSESGSYTEAEIKTVLGKVYDDFHAIDARDFTMIHDYPDILKKIREDLYKLLEQKALIQFQIQFIHGDRKEAIHYEVHDFGSIVNDSDSGGVDYYQFHKDSKIRIVAEWNKKDEVANEYMEKRGWTAKGSFVQGESSNQGDYTNGNLSINKSIIK